MMINHFLMCFATATALACTFVSPAASQTDLPSFDASDAGASFRDMAEYLSRDGGRWKAPNPNHVTGERSPTHFGLVFESVMGGRVLELQIVSYFGESTRVSAKAYWIWHPGRSTLTYQMVSRNGQLSEGTTSFPEPRTFTTVVSPAGEPSGVSFKDENVLLSGTLHRNLSYRREGEGSWVLQGEYEWGRMPR